MGVVRKQEGDRLLDGTVLRGGDRSGVSQETQEGRALAFVEPRQQGQVVVAGERCMRLALRQDRVGIRQQQAFDRRKLGISVDILVLAGQHRLAQQRNKGVSFLRVPGAMLVKRLLGPVVHAGGEADEHLGRIVQLMRYLAAQQGGHDGHASGRGHMGQGGGIERLGLGGKVPELAVRDAGEHLVRNRLSAQPGEMGQVLAHALRAGARRFRLHLVPCRSLLNPGR